MHIAIIGNGISGVTAARFLRKLSDHEITIISSESRHFYSRPALMYIYMGHMRFEDTKPYEDWFWEKNRIQLVYDHVQHIDTASQSLTLKGGDAIAYDKLILAVGSKSNKFGWPGQDLEAVRGLYDLSDLEEMERYSTGLNRAVIVGGGLIGIEMAEMFHTRGIPVTMLVRENNYWSNVLPREESFLIGQHIKDHHIDLRLGVNLQEIVDDGSGRAAGVVIKETGEKIDCGFVGLTAGVSPNIDFLKATNIELGRGIKVNEYLETSVPGVYAIGDCAELRNPAPGRRPIEAIWYTGRMMGETAAYHICGKPVAYNPGIWFNSAKFLDIEYQVYGDVPSKLKDHQAAIYWQHEDGTKSIRLVYHKENLTIEGFNLLGIRYRHEVCEKWLKEKASMEQVISNLSLANFDPEFFKVYEQQVVDLFNHQTGSNLKLKSKRSLDQVINFLRGVRS